MFIVAWVTRVDDNCSTDKDHYQRTDDPEEARRVYDRVRQRTDTYTASLAIELDSTDAM